MSAPRHRAADSHRGYQAEQSPMLRANLGDLFTRAQRVKYAVLLGALVALGPFTIDLYLPAFPSVVRELATTDAAVQLTLTATTIGFGIGQLLIGPLSDAIGRKRPLIATTALHVFASVLVVFAPTIEWVMAGRVLQGIGASGSAVIAMAVARDLFAGQGLVRMISRLVLVTGFAPILAPVIGSQLLYFVDWRGIFVGLAGYGLAMTVVAGFLLTETHGPERRGRFSAPHIGRRFRALLSDPAFVGVALVGAATVTSLFAYLSASSFILQGQFGLTAQQFGLVFGTNSVGLVIGTQLSGRLMRRVPPQNIAAVGLLIMTGGAIALVVCATLDLGLFGVLIPLFFAIAPTGVVMSTIQVLALKDHGSEAGTAASLIGAGNMAVAGTLSPLVGLLGNTALAMASVMFVALACAQAALWLIVRRRSVIEVVS
jgi:DHA1 family bicyclomycin/chloramphenicol resistance-like MFS transporter